MAKNFWGRRNRRTQSEGHDGPLARAIAETLETRTLLSVTPAVAARLAAAGYVSVPWHGTQAYAVPGEYILSVGGLSGGADQEVASVNAKIAHLSKNIKISKQLGASGMFLADVPASIKFADVSAALQGLANLKNLQPNFVETTDTTTPNDPSFANGSQWDLLNTGQNSGTAGADISATKAWDITTGSSSVVVADLDTGIDYNHPDLAANVWNNPTDGSHGYNFIANTNDPLDDNDHGTHTAGTIGAVGNNGTGIAGINWNVKLMAVKVFNSSGSGNDANIIAGINWIVAEKNAGVNVKAINASFGGSGFDSAMSTAIQNAGNAGIMFVAAAGNSGTNNDSAPFYPASYGLSNEISVAATDRNDALASFSNFGATTVNIGAPGVSTLSTVRVSNGSYATFSGTSMATPHVTGVAALAWAGSPNSTVAQIRSAILNGGDSIPSLSGKTTTGKRLDAFGALQQLGLGTGAFSAHYDFGTSTSPVASGYTRVADSTTFTNALGYGWQSGVVQSRDRGTVNGATALTEDFNLIGSGGATFGVNLPNGTYNVTVTVGDPSAAHDQQGFSLEGGPFDSITTATGQYVTKTYAATVTDGQLNVAVKDLGGTDPNSVIDGLDIVTQTQAQTPAPGAPVLAAATDSGASPSDGITNFNNSSAARALQFTVPNTVNGAAVKLLADGVVIGSGTGNGGTITITTNGTTTLTQGTHSFVANQTASGQTQSNNSAATSVTVDGEAPSPSAAPANVTTAGGTTYTFTVGYLDNTSGVLGSSLGTGDVVVSSPTESYTQTATFVSATPAGNANSVTATYTITPPGGAWDSADNGTYTLTMQPNQVADVAGNTSPANATALNTFTVNVAAGTGFTAHYDFGTASSPVASGYTRVADSTTFTAALGFGWQSGVIQSRDRGTVNSATALTEDFNLIGSGGATFGVNLPNGTYSVTVTVGDPSAAHDQQGFSLEGGQFDSITTATGQYVTKTYAATVTDGQLNVAVKDLGGTDPNSVIDGLDIVTQTQAQTPAPGAPVLAAATDSGASASDGVTNFDNSSGAKALQFTVPSTVSGATVTLYADGVAIGTGTGNGGTLAVTTNGTATLAQGAHAFTARQTASGQSQSVDSAAASVTVDTAAPAAASTATNVTTAGGTTYSFTVTYTDATSGVLGSSLGTGDVVVSSPTESYTQTATFVSASPAGNAGTVTATYSITPPGGAWDTADNGSYTLAMQPNRAADVAGNVAPANPSLGSFTVNIAAGTGFTAHFDFGTATSPVASGYTRVADTTAFSNALGYGWLSGSVASRDRGAVNGATALTEDFDFAGSVGATFAVNLPNGTYSVTATVGDPTSAHDQQGISLEGGQFDSVTTAAGQYSTKTYSVTVTDGQLNLLLRDLGGTDGNAVIDGLDVVQTG